MAKRKDPFDDLELDELKGLDQFDNEGSEFDFDASFPDIDSDAERAPIDEQKGIGSKLTGGALIIAGGAAKAIKAKVKDAFPDSTHLADEALNIASDFSRLKYEFTKDMDPIINQTKNVARRVSGKLADSGVMPAAINAKLQKMLKTEDYGGSDPSKEETQTAAIGEALKSVFTSQGIRDEYKTREDRVNKFLDRKQSLVQHRDVTNLLQDIRSQSLHITSFLGGPYTSYLKKSLELKYKHLFVAQDTLEILRVHAQNTEGKLEAIRHNVALPDIQKEHTMETFSALSKNKLMTKFQDYASDFGANVLKNVKTNILDPMKEGSSMLGDMLEGVEMTFDMQQEEAEMTGRKPKGIAGTVGAGASKGLIALLGKERASALIDKHLGPHKGGIEDYAATAKNRLMWGANSVAKHGKGEGMLKDGGVLQSILQLLMPEMDTTLGGSTNVLAKDPTKATQFDIATRQSIVEIIPGYLGKILQQVTNLATGTESEEMVFDPSKRDFIRQSRFQADMEEKLFGDKVTRTRAMSGSIDKMKTNYLAKVGVMDRNTKGASFDEINDDIAKFTFNMAQLKEYYEDWPKEVKILVDNDFDFKDNSDYFKKYFKGVRNTKAVANVLLTTLFKDDGTTIDTKAQHNYERAMFDYAEKYLDAHKDKLLNVIEGHGQSRHLKNILSPESNSNIMVDIDRARDRSTDLDQNAVAEGDTSKQAFDDLKYRDGEKKKVNGLIKILMGDKDSRTKLGKAKDDLVLKIKKSLRPLLAKMGVPEKWLDKIFNTDPLKLQLTEYDEQTLDALEKAGIKLRGYVDKDQRSDFVKSNKMSPKERKRQEKLQIAAFMEEYGVDKDSATEKVRELNKLKAAKDYGTGKDTFTQSIANSALVKNTTAAVGHIGGIIGGTETGKNVINKFRDFKKELTEQQKIWIKENPQAAATLDEFIKKGGVTAEAAKDKLNKLIENTSKSIAQAKDTVDERVAAAGGSYIGAAQNAANDAKNALNNAKIEAESPFHTSMEDVFSEDGSYDTSAFAKRNQRLIGSTTDYANKNIELGATTVTAIGESLKNALSEENLDKGFAAAKGFAQDIVSPQAQSQADMDALADGKNLHIEHAKDGVGNIVNKVSPTITQIGNLIGSKIPKAQQEWLNKHTEEAKVIFEDLKEGKINGSDIPKQIKAFKDKHKDDAVVRNVTDTVSKVKKQVKEKVLPFYTRIENEFDTRLTDEQREWLKKHGAQAKVLYSGLTNGTIKRKDIHDKIIEYKQKIIDKATKKLTEPTIDTKPEVIPTPDIPTSGKRKRTRKVKQELPPEELVKPVVSAELTDGDKSVSKAKPSGKKSQGKPTSIPKSKGKSKKSGSPPKKSDDSLDHTDVGQVPNEATEIAEHIESMTKSLQDHHNGLASTAEHPDVPSEVASKSKWQKFIDMGKRFLNEDAGTLDLEQFGKLFGIKSLQPKTPEQSDTPPLPDLHSQALIDSSSEGATRDAAKKHKKDMKDKVSAPDTKMSDILKSKDGKSDAGIFKKLLSLAHDQLMELKEIKLNTAEAAYNGVLAAAIQSGDQTAINRILKRPGVLHRAKNAIHGGIVDTKDSIKGALLKAKSKTAGVRHAASTVGKAIKTVALAPYKATFHAAKAAVINFADVYRSDDLSKPLVRKAQFTNDANKDIFGDEYGLMHEDGKPVKSIYELNGPIYERSKKGKEEWVPVITEEDITAGITDSKGRKIKTIAARAGRLARKGVTGTLGAAKWGAEKLIGGSVDGIGKIATMSMHATGGAFNVARTFIRPFPDVFCVGMDLSGEPLVTGAVIKEHGYFKPKNKDGTPIKVKSSYDIDKPVIHGGTGDYLITLEHLEKGLIDKKGEPLNKRSSKIGRGIGKAFGLMGDAMGLVSGLSGNIIKFAWDMGSKVVKGLFKSENPYQDVYRKGEVHPDKVLVYGKDIEARKIFFVDDGKVVKSAFEINAPVMDKDKKILINEEDIKEGIVNVNGKKLTTWNAKSIGMKLIAGSAGLAWKAVKGIGKGLLGGVKAIGKGIKGISEMGVWASSLVADMKMGLVNIFGGKEERILKVDLKTMVADKLDLIYQVLDSRLGKKAELGDTDGDGRREGSYHDAQNDKKAKKAKQLADRASIGNRLAGVGGAAAGAAAPAGSGDSSGGGFMQGVAEVAGGHLATKYGGKVLDKVKNLPGVNKVGGLLSKLPGKYGKIGGLLAGGAAVAGGAAAAGAGGGIGGAVADVAKDAIITKGATMAGSALLNTGIGTAITGGLSTAGTAIGGGLAATGSAIGTAAAGVGSGIGAGAGMLGAAIASNPVGWAVGGALALGIGGYMLYKWAKSKSKEEQDLLDFRMKMYGVESGKSSDVESLEKRTFKIANGGDPLSAGELEDYAKDFGCFDKSKVKESVGYFNTWYTKRFAPVFESLLHGLNYAGIKYSDIGSITEAQSKEVKEILTKFAGPKAAAASMLVPTLDAFNNKDKEENKGTEEADKKKKTELQQEEERKAQEAKDKEKAVAENTKSIASHAVQKTDGTYEATQKADALAAAHADNNKPKTPEEAEANRKEQIMKMSKATKESMQGGTSTAAPETKAAFAGNANAGSTSAAKIPTIPGLPGKASIPGMAIAAGSTGAPNTDSPIGFSRSADGKSTTYREDNGSFYTRNEETGEERSHITNGFKMPPRAAPDGVSGAPKAPMLTGPSALGSGATTALAPGYPTTASPSHHNPTVAPPGASGTTQGKGSGQQNLSSGSYKFGAQTAKMEAGGNPGMVSKGDKWGDPGGVSYGKYQFASKGKIPEMFMSSPQSGKYGAILKAAGPVNSPEFKAKWAELGKDPEFEKAQDAFGKKMYLDDNVKKYPWIANKSPMVQEAIMHAYMGGPTQGKHMVNAINKAGGEKLSDKEILQLMDKEYKANIGKTKGFWAGQNKDATFLKKYDEQQKVLLAAQDEFDRNKSAMPGAEVAPQGAPGSTPGTSPTDTAATTPAPTSPIVAGGGTFGGGGASGSFDTAKPSEKLDVAQNTPAGAPSTPGTPTAPGAPGAGGDAKKINPDEGLSKLKLDGGVTVAGLQPGMKKAVGAANAEFMAKYGRPFLVTSGSRTMEKQKELYDKLGPTKAARPSPNAPHIKGIAVDVNTPDANKLAESGILSRYGLSRPLWPNGKGRVKPEPWHIQMSGVPAETGVEGDKKEPTEQELAAKKQTESAAGAAPGASGTGTEAGSGASESASAPAGDASNAAPASGGATSSSVASDTTATTSASGGTTSVSSSSTPGITPVSDIGKQMAANVPGLGNFNAPAASTPTPGTPSPVTQATAPSGTDSSSSLLEQTKLMVSILTSMDKNITSMAGWNLGSKMDSLAQNQSAGNSGGNGSGDTGSSGSNEIATPPAPKETQQVKAAEPIPSHNRSTSPPFSMKPPTSPLAVRRNGRSSLDINNA